jgi:hypothetical protein
MVGLSTSKGWTLCLVRSLEVGVVAWPVVPEALRGRAEVVNFLEGRV